MRRATKKQCVLEYAGARGWSEIGEAEWRELKSALPGVSDANLRSSGLCIAQPWRGIRQHTLEDLEESLHEYTRIYVSRPDLRAYCRAEVIAAKDRARWIAKTRKLPVKSEMVDWMLVWLGDPSMFGVWVQARRAQIGLQRAESAT